MNILVIGSNGQLGKSFKKISPRYDHEWTFLSHNELDITDRAAVYWYLKTHLVDVCINCAAYTNVDGAESDEYNAVKVNYIGLANLAEWCKEFDVFLVNYSTDYVFDYEKRISDYDKRNNPPYTETSKPCPKSIYALTKLMGDKALEKANPNYINIRTSWVFSEFNKNFVKTIISKIDKGEEIKVVNDQIGCPTYASDLAEVTMNLIKKHFKINKLNCKKRKCHEIYNFNNGETMSWHDFAIKIAMVYGKKCIIEPTFTFSQIAHRPSYSALDISKFKKETNISPRNVNDALIECINVIRIEKENL